MVRDPVGSRIVRAACSRYPHGLKMPNGRDPRLNSNLPIYALICAVAFFALAVAALAVVDLDDNTTPGLLMLVGLVVTTVPSLVAAAFSERAARDIRNGTVTQKVKDALQELGYVGGDSTEERNVTERDRRQDF